MQFHLKLIKNAFPIFELGLGLWALRRFWPLIFPSEPSLSVVIIHHDVYNRVRVILLLLVFVLKDHDLGFVENARLSISTTRVLGAGPPGDAKVTERGQIDDPDT